MKVPEGGFKDLDWDEGPLPHKLNPWPLLVIPPGYEDDGDGQGE